MATENYDNKEIFIKFGTRDFREMTIDSSQIKRPNGDTLEETLVDFETRLGNIEQTLGLPYDTTDTVVSRLQTLEGFTLPEFIVTSESVVHALGYVPAHEGNWAVFEGATDSLPGVMGVVPQPVAGQESFFLRGDGVWAPNPTEGFIDKDTADSYYMKAAERTSYVSSSAIANYYTKSEADATFLGIKAKAESAKTADVAYSIPTSETATGNVWIKER